ncbi:MAG TPA: hypothetical protein QF870_03355, partial [Nitrospinota bacterium]|nr:hypothetical protein [Nitrospinota bacterium]
MDVHRPCDRSRFVAPDLNEQPVAVQGLSIMLQKKPQEAEFHGRETDVISRPSHPPLGGIAGDVRETVNKLPGPVFRPPDQGLDPCEQFRQIHRFAQIIVRARLETLQHVLFQGLRRQKKNHQVMEFRAQLPTHFQTVHARHHDVQNDHVRSILNG